MKENIHVEIEQRQRPQPVPDSVADMDLSNVKITDVVRHEIYYIAHISTRFSDHHAEGATAAMALVDAALHWERYERGRR